MDTWQAVQNYVIFLPIAGAVAWYYWPATRPRSTKAQAVQTPPVPSKRRQEQDPRQKPSKRTDIDDAGAAAVQNAKPNPRKRKAKDQSPRQNNAPAVVVQQSEQDDGVDNSAKQFAQQMQQVRQGQTLTGGKSSENRLKTVKQGSAQATPVASSGASEAGADADDDLSPGGSPAVKAGDVSDMLEQVAPGPSTLRLTAPTKPQKERVARQLKEESAETKKQRQNRQRVEERRLQREEEERQRKGLEEKQRRAAREARGEPAKNGIPVAKPPANNPWNGQSAPAANAQEQVNGDHTAPLLDTFDAESNSSGGGPEPSTAATSTTEAGPTQRDHDMLSEEDQIAMAMKQSEDESGWTTVAVPKKVQKKKADDGENTAPTKNGANGALNGKPVTSAAKSATQGKATGYHALNVEYEQRSDADPTDASNWDA